MAKTMKLITPCLWCNGNAKEMAEFYVSVFPNSKMGAITTYPKTGKEHHGHEAGEVLTVEFELDGQGFMLLNGGPQFPYSNAVSFVIPCKDQKEIDYYWDKLSSDGGEEVECGWVKDKFGLSWQVSPDNVSEFLTEYGPEGKEAYMAALMQMKKLDIETLERAAKDARKAA